MSTRRELLEQQFNEPQEDVKQEVEIIAEPVEQPESRESRLRDEAGKFKAKEATQQEVIPVPPSSGSPVDVADEAPKSWKPEQRDKWSKLDPETKQYLRQREDEQEKGVEPIKAKAKQYDSIYRELEPIIPDLERNGADTPTFLRDVVTSVKQLASNDPKVKLQTWLKIGQSYNVPMHQLLSQVTNPLPQQQTQAPQEPSYDPRIDQALTRAQRAEQAVTEFQINQFKQGKEHFDAVEPVMVKLINAGMASGLQDAYDQAIRLTPEIYDAQLLSQKAAEATRQKEEADKAAKAAKAGAVSIKTATPTGVGKNASATGRRALLEEQFAAQASGRI